MIISDNQITESDQSKFVFIKSYIDLYDHKLIGIYQSS